MKIEKITSYKITIEILNKVINFTTTQEVKNENDAFDIVKNNIDMIRLVGYEIDIYKYNERENGMLERFLTLPIIDENYHFRVNALEKCGDQIENKDLIEKIIEPYRKYIDKEK